MGESSISDLENRASAGDSSAQVRLALVLLESGQVEPGRNWLRRAAEAGSTDLKLALGEHLLANPPYGIAEGVHWTRVAAQEGSAEAVHRLAVFAAEGVGEPQSWSNALLQLRRAAELGQRTAQAELAVLSGNWVKAKALLHGTAESTEPELPGDAIDLASWLQVPAARPELQSPRVFTVARFLSPGVCDWLMERARPNLQRAQTFNPRTGGAQVVEGRNHSCTGFNVARSDVVIAIIRARMAALTGHALTGFEDTSVLHYSPGEQFAPHYDFIEPNTTAALRDIAGSGQRAVTFLVYLNEGYDGGETSFPRLGRTYKGNKGDALFYENVMPDGSPDRRTLHTGTILKRGEKWLMSQWIRSRPAWHKGQ